MSIHSGRLYGSGSCRKWFGVDLGRVPGFCEWEVELNKLPSGAKPWQDIFDPSSSGYHPEDPAWQQAFAEWNGQRIPLKYFNGRKWKTYHPDRNLREHSAVNLRAGDSFKAKWKVAPNAPANSEPINMLNTGGVQGLVFGGGTGEMPSNFTYSYHGYVRALRTGNWTEFYYQPYDDKEDYRFEWYDWETMGNEWSPHAWLQWYRTNDKPQPSGNDGSWLANLRIRFTIYNKRLIEKGIVKIASNNIEGKLGFVPHGVAIATIDFQLPFYTYHVQDWPPNNHEYWVDYGMDCLYGKDWPEPHPCHLPSGYKNAQLGGYVFSWYTPETGGDPNWVFHSMGYQSETLELDAPIFVAGSPELHTKRLDPSWV